MQEGKEVYFLDSENKPVRVKSITKQAYNGKIYDVDVENDIVLVKRQDGKALWSGNSNNGTEILTLEEVDCEKDINNNLNNDSNNLININNKNSKT